MSIRRHTAYNLMGAIVPLAVSLITIPIYLKMIGAERYGTLAILWTFMGYFGFMNLGLGRAVAQRLASANDSSPAQRE
jgi:O-antigen/teichoic acid export membrane protein